MRIPVVGLLGRPGQRRDLVTSVPPEAFGEEPWGPAVDAFEGEIELDLVLEAVSGGILVRGALRATARGTCARCLAATTDTWEVEVVELHRSVADVEEEEADDGLEDLDYVLVDGDTQLELDQMVRDALVVGQPVRVLCRSDCPTFVMGPNAVSAALLAGGNESQRERYLPELAQGKVASFCLTEEGAGSDS